jgi:phosphate acetyltransferase
MMKHSWKSMPDDARLETAMQYIESRTFEEMHVGDAAQIARILRPQDLDVVAATEQNRARGVWGADFIHELLSTQLPGPGTVYLDLSLHFRGAAAAGDTVTARIRIRARYRQLLDAARRFDPVRTAIVHPCDAVSLASAMEAKEAGLIVPILIGPSAKIRRLAGDAGHDLGDMEIVDVPHSHAAAERAVTLGREAKVEALMKGALHTDELMAAVVDKIGGLRTERRMSHVFALDVPHYQKPLFITDAAVNIAPDLDTKRDIVQNAIELAHALGIECPKVAILSAIETVTHKIPSTIDAAALCKMADRQQIVGGVLDGPLAFDNAISSDAARAKGIISAVAGQVDILVVPDLEAGNMLVKQLTYLAGAQAAGIVLGARLPIILTSRADGAAARLASCALAQLLVRRRIMAS